MLVRISLLQLHPGAGRNSPPLGAFFSYLIKLLQSFDIICTVLIIKSHLFRHDVRYRRDIVDDRVEYPVLLEVISPYIHRIHEEPCHVEHFEAFLRNLYFSILYFPK